MASASRFFAAAFLALACGAGASRPQLVVHDLAAEEASAPEEKVIFGAKCSGTGCASKARCPDGAWPAKCHMLPENAGDGAHVDPMSGACTAHGAASGAEVQAKVTCTAEMQTFSVDSSANFLTNVTISASCPKGSLAISCNCWSSGMNNTCLGTGELKPATADTCSLQVPPSSGPRGGGKVGARIFAVCSGKPVTTPTPTPTGTPAPAAKTEVGGAAVLPEAAEELLHTLAAVDSTSHKPLGRKDTPLPPLEAIDDSTSHKPMGGKETPLPPLEAIDDSTDLAISSQHKLLGAGPTEMVPAPPQQTTSIRTGDSALPPLPGPDEAPQTRTRSLFLGSNGLICGGREIHSLLTSGTSADSVRNLPWSNILAIAEEYVKTQSKAVEQLDVEQREVLAAIPAAEKAEAPAAITEEQMRVVILSALTAEGSFGSLEVAKASQCGSLRTQPRVSKGSYGAASRAFVSAATQLLSGGAIRTSSERLRSFCGSLLEASRSGNASAGPSSCSELCQDFADNAQQISDSKAGAFAVTSKTSNKLRAEAEEKGNKLKFEMAKLSDCKAAKSDLESFRQQLEGLGQNIRDEHEKFRVARTALTDAEWELQDLSAEVEKQMQTVHKLVEVLQGKGKEEQEVQAQLREVEVQVTAVDRAIQESLNLLRQAETEVKKTESASLVANGFKSALSAVMLKMSLYFDAAVREPLRNLGLGEKVDVAAAFPEASHLEARKAARKSLEDLKAFCDDESTRRTFLALNKTDIPVGSLCDFGDVREVVGEIDGAVQTRVQNLVTDLKGVQSWLDTYKGQEGINKSVVEELVKKGELHGLREVATGFGHTQFYLGYLSHWKVSEKFVSLYDTLGAALRAAQGTEAQVKASLDELRSQLNQVSTKKDKAADSLKHAMDANKIAESNKTTAEVQYQQLSGQHGSMKSHIDELSKAAAAAQARWADAQKALESTHRQGVGLVQLVEELERRGAASGAESGAAAATERRLDALLGARAASTPDSAPRRR